MFSRSVLLGVLLLAGAAWGDEAWDAARPDYPWAFPRDHWARPGYRTEWWYLTGHLEAADGALFGYQFTIFRVGLARAAPTLDSAWAARDLVMGHAAIAELRPAGRRVFSEVLYRAIPLLGGFGGYPAPRLAWSRAPAGTDGEWTLDWNGHAFDLAVVDRARGLAFRLATRPVKPLVLEGPGGYSRKGAAATAASQYYSFTRLATEGTLTLGGRAVPVRGESWMDREFGSGRLEPHQAGWDWLGLQLADGRDLMLYLLRDKAGRVDVAHGTLVAMDGRTRYLDAGGFTLRATRTWRSPASGAVYPAGWELAVPGEGIALELVPELDDQENRSERVRGLHYWEGAVVARGPGGRPAGRGYVELVGYGAGSTPAP